MPARADWGPVRQLTLLGPDLCSRAVCPNSGDGIGPTQWSDLLKKVELYYVILTRKGMVENSIGARSTP